MPTPDSVDNRLEIIPNRIYEHYKGAWYHLVCEAKHTETQEPMVIYQDIQSKDIYARPLVEFIATVQPDPEGKWVPRFTLLPLGGIKTGTENSRFTPSVVINPYAS